MRNAGRPLRFYPGSWTVPLALLVLCGLGFGLLIPSLGFYWDDWPSLVIARLQGLHGFEAFFRLDRPTTFISYVLLMPLFGTHPVVWQVFTLLERWLTAVLIWWAARKLWPETGDLPLWAAALFAVYPVFRQQPIALTYHQLWMEFAFFVFSISAMITAVQQRKPGRRWLWTVLALLGSAANFLISEYFLGIELLRPVILWFTLRGQSRGKRQALKRALLAWLPYLGLLLVYLSWRFLFLQLPGADRNAPVLLAELLRHPFSALQELAQMGLQDVAFILVSCWYATFQPDLFDLGSRFNLLTWGAAVLGAAGVGAYLFYFGRRRAAEEDCAVRNARLAVLLGGLIVLLAPLPGWVTGRQVTVGAYSDRLAVPAMLGASLFLAGLVTWFIRSRAQQVLVIAVLAGLAIGGDLRVANDYRWARIQQNRFFWQLYWRAPDITPQTAVMADAEVLPKTGLYSTASGINLIYAGQAPSGDLPYWFFSLSREFSYRMPELLAGMPLEHTFRQFTFHGQSMDSLIVYYEPSSADCLRVPTRQDRLDPALSALVVRSLPISRLERIQPSAQPGRGPDVDIFGPEPAHGWCYLFEKADLARQMGDWAQVASLGDQAARIGFSLENDQSNTPQEWLPFLEGYAHAGRWKEALAINQSVLEKEPKMAPRLCALWSSLGGGTEAAGEVKRMNCPP